MFTLPDNAFLNDSIVDLIDSIVWIILLKVCHFNSGYVFSCVRLAAAIINYQFKAETDQSRVLDMDVHLIRRAYERALLMKRFTREDHNPRQYQEFIEAFFNKILDYRQERNWKVVPVDNCQEYLKFPKVLNTQTANTSDHIRHDSNTFYVWSIRIIYSNH